jgi:hypothetical protein
MAMIRFMPPMDQVWRYTRLVIAMFAPLVANLSSKMFFMFLKLARILFPFINLLEIIMPFLSFT